MKKINVKLYSTLAFGLLSSYLLLSFVWFNSYIESYVSDTIYMEKSTTYFVLNLAVYFVIVLLAKCITRKDVKEISELDNGKESLEKARRRTLIIFNTLYFIMTLLLFYYAYGEFKFIYTGTREKLGLVDILIPIVLSILSLVPGSILLNTVFKHKEKKKGIIYKILRIIKYLFLIGFIISLLIIDVYLLIPINEFKYSYRVDDEIEINQWIYKDIRNWYYLTEYDVPEKIWGKSVRYFGDVNLSKNVKTILLPSSIKFEDLYQSLYYLNPGLNCISPRYIDVEQYVYDKNIVIKGDPKEWYIKDDIIYNKDNTSMFIYRTPEKNVLEIGETIETIYPSTFSKFLKNDTKIIISENNPYFYEYGNVIWSKGNSNNINSPIEELRSERQVDVGIVKTMQINEPIDITITPNSNKKILLWWPTNSISNVGNIIIPKEFSNKEFAYLFPEIVNCKNYEVEEGNPYYSTYDGNLYSKDLTKLYAIRKYDYDEQIKFPKEIQEISDCAIEQLRTKGYNLENAENVILEDGFLYTENYERLLSLFVYHAEYYNLRIGNSSKINNKYIINKNTKEISQNYNSFDFNSICHVEIDSENPYLVKYGSGIYTADKRKLINVDKSADSLIIPEEVIEIDEKILEKASKVTKVLVNKSNQFFETDSELSEQQSGDYVEGKALFTKGRQRLLYGSPSIIPKETMEISKAAINSMIETKIECDENNPYYESYKGMLYTKGRKELLCIGQLEDRTITIAKETTSINRDMLATFIEFHRFDTNDNRNEDYVLYKYLVEEGNVKFGVYNGNLYEDNFSRILLFNAIQDIAPSSFSKNEIHPDCKYVDDLAYNCIGTVESYSLNVSKNKYIQSAHRYVDYYPEYKYLNLAK